MNRGQSIFHTNGELQITTWQDNNEVTVINTYGNDQQSKVRRYNRHKQRYELINIPEVISNYNKHMGGVDLFDQSVSAYRSKIRVKKWHWPIFLYMLDGAISNAWHIYLDSCDSTDGLLEFRRNICKILLDSRQKKVYDPKKVVV